MKHILRKLAATLLVAAFLFAPLLVIAQQDGSACPANTLCNPIKYNNADQLLKALLKVVAQFAAIVAVIMFVYAGFIYVTAQGDEKKIEQAHKTFKYTAIGTAILLGAELLAAIIRNTIDKVSGPSPL